MRFSLLIILQQLFFISFSQIDCSMIKIEVKLDDKPTNNELYEKVGNTIINEDFNAILYITNISNKSIRLPRSFDLGYFLIDKQGQLVPVNKAAIYEYVPKVNLSKRKIKSGETITVSFTEDRLSYENVIVEGNRYWIRYFLVHPKISREINSSTIELKF